LSTLSILAAETARAVTVPYYINIQPIDVCGRTGLSTVCAPFNSLSPVGHPNDPNAPIGFVDAATGINITDAIWSQAGIRVNFQPVQQYITGGTTGFNFLTLHVRPDPTTKTGYTSDDFMTLSQQPAIKSGTVPNPTSPPGVPVSPNATTINMFFVNRFDPPVDQSGGTLYGFSWLNNNGISIAMNTFFPNAGVTLRVDTIAHEIGHNLDLNHDTFGASPSAPENLMTVGGNAAGDVRIVPTSAANALTQLANQTADQLTLTSGPLGSQSQQSHALLSGFINAYGGVSGTVMGSTPPPAVALTAASTSGPFHVSFDSPGRPGEFLSALTLTAPPGTFFNDGTFAVIGANLNAGGTVTGAVICPTGVSCPRGTGTELELEFSPSAFTLSDSLDYTIGVCRTGDFEGCRAGRPDLLLNGGTYTYLFETDGLRDGVLVPFEQFETTSDLLSSDSLFGGLFADSQQPDLRIPSQVLNPDTFVGFGSLPCTPVAGSCPPLELEDANPSQEGGQLPVPEPPSLVLLLAALVGLTTICRLLPRRSFEAGLP
jgi:hypothetical protein